MRRFIRALVHFQTRFLQDYIITGGGGGAHTGETEARGAGTALPTPPHPQPDGWRDVWASVPPPHRTPLPCAGPPPRSASGPSLISPISSALLRLMMSQRRWACGRRPLLSPLTKARRLRPGPHSSPSSSSRQPSSLPGPEAEPGITPPRSAPAFLALSLSLPAPVRPEFQAGRIEVGS